MLRNIPLMLEITKEVVKAVKTPVTVKTRLGWDSENLVITTLAEQLQDCGIEALTIHGRTRAQMYTGNADWSLIKEVKDNPRIHIPIIGNGDITTAEEAKMAFERYGVDAVMVGRATFGRPWVFKEMNELILGIDGTSTALTIDDKIDILKNNSKSMSKRSMNIVEFCTLDVILHRVRYSKAFQTLNKPASLC